MCRLRVIAFLLLGGCLVSTKDVPRATKNTDQPILATPLGQVQGSILASRLGKQIFSFRGIPYAKPPINERRFQPPAPAEKWEGVLNATEDAPLCPQPTADPTSEDCLFLNVYTTKLPDGNDSPRRPVVVFLHAGGFYSVGGASYWTGPQYLMDHELVLVTLNYRLGTLGFLATGDKEAPGNNGLKDQVQALRWVQQNIEAFGGDPAAVTLMGYSAGAVSITLHLVSPLSKGLFHKAIVMSGSALGNWPVPKEQLELARKQARFVGCPDDTPSNIVKCLKTKSAMELGDTLPKFQEFGHDPILIWSPVIEEDFGQERFLPEHPIQLYLKGEHQKMPVMTGITTDEFGARAFTISSNDTLKKQFIQDFDEVAPIAFQYERGTNFSKRVSRALKEFYFNSNFGDNFLPNLAHLYADSIIGFSVHRFARLASVHNNHSLYYYRFNYKGQYSHFYLPDSNGTRPYGVVHHDDLIYLFYIQKLFPFFKDTDQDTRTVEKLTLLWANFIRTGDPVSTTPKNAEQLDYVKWEPYDADTQKYLDIGNKLKMEAKLYEDRYKEWDKLYPLNLYLDKAN